MSSHSSVQAKPAWHPPGGEGRCAFLLAGRIHVDHCKVLRDLLHVLIVEEGVEARLVLKGANKGQTWIQEFKLWVAQDSFIISRALCISDYVMDCITKVDVAQGSDKWSQCGNALYLQSFKRWLQWWQKEVRLYQSLWENDPCSHLIY